MFFPVAIMTATTVFWLVTGRASPVAPQVPHEGGDAPELVFCDALQMTMFRGAQVMPLETDLSVAAVVKAPGFEGAVQPVEPVGAIALLETAYRNRFPDASMAKPKESTGWNPIAVAGRKPVVFALGR